MLSAAESQKFELADHAHLIGPADGASRQRLVTILPELQLHVLVPYFPCYVYLHYYYRQVVALACIVITIRQCCEPVEILSVKVITTCNSCSRRFKNFPPRLSHRQHLLMARDLTSSLRLLSGLNSFCRCMTASSENRSP